MFTKCAGFIASRTVQNEADATFVNGTLQTLTKWSLDASARKADDKRSEAALPKAAAASRLSRLLRASPLVARARQFGLPGFGSDGFPALTSIFRGCTSPFLGILTVRTPSLISAWTWSPATLFGSAKERVKVP